MRRGTTLTVALAALLLLAVPSAASARLSVQIDADGLEGAPGKTLLINGDGADDTIRLSQEDRGTFRRISVLGQGNTGSGCVQVISSPARMRCETDGIVQIVVLASPQLFADNASAETNTIDLSGVTQTGPDGAQVVGIAGGGPGPDVIVGNTGRSLLGGGTGNDRLEGGDGNDDINEGPGDDIVLAGPGDDTFGGEPTDGSDIASGGPGSDSIASRGVVTLNDLLCNDGATPDASDEPLGQVRRVEAPEGVLECSGTGADRDLIVGVEAVAQVFRDDPADFTGTGADEVFQARGGADRFEGGGGRDSISGFGGDDLLLGRDDVADTLFDCGEGAGDRAVVDAIDPVDPSCETIERGGAGVTGPVVGQGDQPSNGAEGGGPGGGDGLTPPELEIPTRVAFVKNRRVEIRVRCVYRAQNCVGRLTLKAAQSKRAGDERVRKGEKLASGDVDVPWGTSEPTTLRAPRDLVRLLKDLGGSRTLKVTATVVARDSAAGPDAQSARASRKVVLGLQR